MELNRREFLGRSAAGLSVFCFGANPLLAASEGAALGNDRILVLLELAGGNDGLSTVVPFGDDTYARNRHRTRIQPREVLPLNRYLGFHPELAGVKELYDGGKVAVVQGVGYPDPDRSHFKSMDIWHAADPRGRQAGRGWVGRMVDHAFAGSQDPNLVVHVGTRIPFSLQASVHHPIAFTTPEAYRWIGADREIQALEEAAVCEHEPMRPEVPRKKSAFPGRDDALSRLRRTLRDAQQSSNQVREAARSYRPKADYPASTLAGSLATIAALVHGGLGTRIFSVQTGGFDTHVNQRDKHDRLMRTVSWALAAFFEDLEAHGVADRVLVLAYSEFGRRLKENGSQGTDHGVAGPMFLFGKSVRGGLHGQHPSLSRLDKGDLIHNVDFRQVYASVIDDWLGASHREVLGKSWSKLELVKG